MESNPRYPHDPKMVIYQIYNRANGKSYVGQAVNGFCRRYDSRNWWTGNINRHIKRSVAKYGHRAFGVCLLETNVSSLEELNRLEMEHIKRLDCICPKGYNYQAGGQMTRNRKHHVDSCDRMAMSLSGGKRHRLLNNRTGVIHEFVNIERFANEHGLSGSMLSVLLSERPSKKSSGPYYVQHKGWSLPHRPVRRICCVSPEGEEYLVLDGVDGGVKGFCKRVGICSTGVFKAISGQHRQSNGWTFRILPPLP